MEIPPLPLYLRTKTNQDIPSAVYDRLNFLWSAATNDLPRTPDPDDPLPAAESTSDLIVVSTLSHRLSKEFINVVKANKVDLPAYITDRLCGNCSILLIPSVSYQIRLRPRSRVSKANRNKKDRMKNQLVMHCTACNSTWKAPGYIRKSKESVTQPNNVITQAAFAGTSSGIKTSVSKQDLKNAGEKRKFSFLNKGQGAGAAQDQKSTSGILKGDSKDFMSFSAAPSSNLSTSNANSLQSLTKGLFARGGTASATAVTKTGSSSGSSGTLTLLELEALSKKNKKKKI